MTNAAPAISGARVDDADPASFSATVTDAGRAGRADGEARLGQRLARPRRCRWWPTSDGYVVMAAPRARRDREAGRPTATAARRGDRDARARARQRRADRRRRGRPSVRRRDVDVDLPATDPEGERLEYEIVDQPEHGTVSMRASTARARAARRDLHRRRRVHGADTFTYRVSRQRGPLARGRVTVTVAGAAADEGGGPAPSPSPSPRPPRRRPSPPRAAPAARAPSRSTRTPSRTPRARSGAAQGAVPAASQIVRLPSSKRCVSRRKFRIRVKRMKTQGAYKRSR